jgi:hypothetical protein
VAAFFGPDLASRPVEKFEISIFAQCSQQWGSIRGVYGSRPRDQLRPRLGL